MRDRTYGGVRGRKTKVGRKLLRFPPTRLSLRALYSVLFIRNEMLYLAGGGRGMVVAGREADKGYRS